MEVAVITYIFSIFFNTHFSEAKLKDDVSFHYYVGNKPTLVGYGSSKDELQDTGCRPSDEFAFIVHGWKEGCDKTSWPKMLREKLTTYRGGCIVCIDYERPASKVYSVLFTKFNSLVKIMTRKLKDLFDQGVDPSKTYFFGFSFGGQLALAIGAKFRDEKIQEVDVCDPAGVGFDWNPLVNYRRAGHNVQCIHTSVVVGTWIYACHQNWRMGLCGSRQPFQLRPSISHLYCPLFYISAFDNPFYAVRKPITCTSLNRAKIWPQGFKMGYTEKRKSEVTGELFALTQGDYPYNVLSGRRMTSQICKLNSDSIITFIVLIFDLIFVIV